MPGRNSIEEAAIDIESLTVVDEFELDRLYGAAVVGFDSMWLMSAVGDERINVLAFAVSRSGCVRLPESKPLHR